MTIPLYGYKISSFLDKPSIVGGEYLPVVYAGVNYKVTVDQIKTYVQSFGGTATWGAIVGTLSSQSDLNTALGLKANTASLGTVAALSYPGGTANFLRADGTFAAPPGGGGAVWGSITGTLASQTDLSTSLSTMVSTTTSLSTTTSTGLSTAVSRDTSLSTTISSTNSSLTSLSTSSSSGISSLSTGLSSTNSGLTSLSTVASTTNSSLTSLSTSTSSGLSTTNSSLTSLSTSVLSMAVNSQSAAYTLVLGDAGKVIYHPSADTTARVWTIPANASVAFPIGTPVTFDNDAGAGAVTIAITTDTLVLVGGAGSTGSRTLASGGRATAMKVTATRWRIDGALLT